MKYEFLELELMPYGAYTKVRNEKGVVVTHDNHITSFSNEDNTININACSTHTKEELKSLIKSSGRLVVGMQDVDTLVETPDGKAFKEYTVTYEPDEWDAKFSQHWKSVKERVEAHRAG